MGRLSLSIHKRKYKRYKDYISHQSDKLTDWIGNRKRFNPTSFTRNVRSFKKRISKFIEFVHGPNVLCLGARLGEEVVAFRKMGFPDTMGIDLNPGEDNPYVIKGDFHNMRFEDSSFNSVYTNCIDHAWDLKMLSAEVSRVLVPHGVFILEIGHLVDKNKKERMDLIRVWAKYESLMYDKSNDIVNNLPEFVAKIKVGESYGRIVLILDNIKGKS